MHYCNNRDGLLDPRHVGWLEYVNVQESAGSGVVWQSITQFLERDSFSSMDF